MTLEQAREVIPFQIQVAEYVPQGYALEEYVLILEGPGYGNEVRGVYMSYSAIDPERQQVPKQIVVEQQLGKKSEPTVGIMGGQQVGSQMVEPAELPQSLPEDVGGFQADIWERSDPAGHDLTVVIWEDEDRGVWFPYGAASTRLKPCALPDPSGEDARP